MKKTALTLITILVFATLCMTGCSKEESKVDKAKNEIQKFTDKTADKAVKKIKTPIDKAKKISQVGSERLEEMEKALERH
ncbi:MAG: hypothetical protein KKE17_02325 [Proteobacteria bacterium]|nr:hypothetical protein [Pseudomonadota bacterium]MBU1708817.1 hypothetical protein [Pseudomonadota bacterium]